MVQSKEVFLTVEGQIAKNSGEEVHDEHPQDGNVANVLHSSLGWASGEKHDRRFKQEIMDHLEIYSHFCVTQKWK